MTTGTAQVLKTVPAQLGIGVSGWRSAGIPGTWRFGVPGEFPRRRGMAIASQLLSRKVEIP